MMSSIVTGSLLGLALGVRHSLEPDHLAAVGTFVSRTTHPRRAAVVGALWGAGHSVSLLVLGALVLVLRGHIPDWLDGVLESLVGVMLIALGARAIIKARGREAADEGTSTSWSLLRRHGDRHSHSHSHVHVHAHPHLHAHLHAHPHRHTNRDGYAPHRDHTHEHEQTHPHAGVHSHPLRAALPPFAVGLGHGIAGTGAAVLLATATMPSTRLGVLFLGLFGAGSLVGMAALASLLCLTFRRANTGFRGRKLRLPLFAGVFSVVIGAWWIVQQHL
ncbi:MAG: hypothetical protein IPK13_16505 [Deltaproteobacteria bacterium]|nr:hypothetical protein [Deltaproteobacteria bacterium]